MWYKAQKYKAKATVCVSGHKHPSRLEAAVCNRLAMMGKGGLIKAFETQVKFRLFGINEGFICNHIVDFLVETKDGRKEVWEAKGLALPAWKIKAKLFQDNYPEIKYVVVKK